MTPSPFEPARLGPLTLRNRVIKAATFEGMIHDGLPTLALLDHHVELARGGVGMTTIAYCAASADGRTFANQMAMRPALVPHLRRITDAVHAEGAAASLQIGHCGHFSKNGELRGRRPLGPSQTWNPYGLVAGLPFAGAMTEADIARTVDEFAEAAGHAREAGFDAVELHLGHGYLLSQFISPLLNRRRDAYGGSLENRMRFPLRVVEAVRARVGEGVAIVPKINLSDGKKGGLEVDEALRVAELLEAAGVDAIEMSGGLVDRSALYLLRGGRPLAEMVEVESSRAQKLALRVFGPALIEAVPFEPMFFLEEARRVRAAVTVPLVLLGGITDKAHLTRAMAEGFEFVAMGRALIHDPGLIGRYARGEAERSGCEPCNVCITEMERPGGVRCARRPEQLEARARSVAAGRHVTPA